MKWQSVSKPRNIHYIFLAENKEHAHSHLGLASSEILVIDLSPLFKILIAINRHKASKVKIKI